MSLIKFKKSIESKYGKFFSFLLSVLIFNLSSCTFYKPAVVSVETIKSNEYIQNNISSYKFYVHDSHNSYMLNNVFFNEEGNISGDIEITKYEKPDSTWTKKQKKEYWENHKLDINIYTLEDYSFLTANASDDLNFRDKKITITAEKIDYMTITSKDNEKKVAGAVLVVLVLLCAVLLTVLTIFLITKTIEAGADGSSNASGNSNSNSNSGGSSGGGGSGSGSGSSG